MGRLSDVGEFENIIVKSQPPSHDPAASSTVNEVNQTAAVVRIRDIAKVETE